MGACIGQNNVRFFFLWLYWIAVGGFLGGGLSVWPVVKMDDTSKFERNALSFCLSLSLAVRPR